MTRKQFVQLHGATCNGWQFSWSFINKRKRLIIFGAFDANLKRGGKQTILSKAWMKDKRGHKNKGYGESKEHIRLIEKEGYRLMTFPMEYGETKKGTAEIKRIIPVLTEKKLTSDGREWFANDLDDVRPVRLAEEISAPEKYVEGLRFKVTINGYERNPKARAACIAHHGCKCTVCKFDFGEKYGALGRGFIHVHHIAPIGKTRGRYKIDPKKDLVPVCPNCHAMIHLAEPVLTIRQLRSYRTGK